MKRIKRSIVFLFLLVWVVLPVAKVEAINYLVDVFMTSDSAPSPFVASADSEYSGYEAWHACDWLDSAGFVSGGTALPHWWKVDLGETVTVSGAVITGSVSATQSPTAFTILGSTDNSSWTTLSTQTGLSWAASERKTFTFTAFPLRYFKINMTAVGSGNYAGLYEVRIISPPSSPGGGLVVNLGMTGGMR